MICHYLTNSSCGRRVLVAAEHHVPNAVDDVRSLCRGSIDCALALRLLSAFTKKIDVENMQLP